MPNMNAMPMNAMNESIHGRALGPAPVHALGPAPVHTPTHARSRTYPRTYPRTRAIAAEPRTPATATMALITATALTLSLVVALVLALVIAPPSTAFADETGDAPGTGAGAGGDSPAAVQTAGPVPNIIVTSFAYGDVPSVAAGSKFDLTLTYQNMGQVAVGNMVITVDGGESFAIAGGTNTFYVDALWAGYANTLTVPMQALSGAKSGAQGITVGFRYEYVDQNVRSSSSSDIKISVPVSQPDRFEVTEPAQPEELYAGQEATLTLPYVNKGKGDVANVEATMEGEGFQATTATQYVGNVASGATGSIGYAFTPDAAGELKATLKVTYEDSDGNQRTKEFPLALTVADVPMTDPGMVDPGMMVDEEPGLPVWAWAAIAVGVVVVIIAIVMIVRRRKKKAKAHDIDEEWDEWAKEDAGAPVGGGEASGSASSTPSAPDAQPSPRSASGAPTMALDPVALDPVALDPVALDPVASNPRAVMNPPASQASPANPASQKAPGTPTATPRHGSPTPRTRTRTNGGGANTTGGDHTTDGQAS